jgi:hypothetical protein
VSLLDQDQRSSQQLQVQHDSLLFLQQLCVFQQVQEDEQQHFQAMMDQPVAEGE